MKIFGGILLDGNTINPVNSEESKVYMEENKEKSFQELKNKLTSASVLAMPSGIKVYVIYSDASKTGVRICSNAK